MLPCGQRLKALRNEKKLKQKEIADFLGCTDRNYQKMEYGEVNIPGLTLIKLADYYDVSLDYLVGRSEERKKASPLRGGSCRAKRD